jgi:hypothetical protein
MQTRTIIGQGVLRLGEEAERAGYTPGRVVRVSVLSTGSLLVTLDDTPVLIDVKPRLIPAKHKELPGG